jgi:putative transposase
MIKAFKYRLYPNKKTKRILNNTLETCRLLYNQTLETKINLYKNEEKSLKLSEANRIITKNKETNEELTKVYSQVLQDVQKRMFLAYDNFFRRVKQGTEEPGFPRFKSESRYKSFKYKQNNGSFKIIDDKWLYLSKIGNIKINLYREIEGEILNCTVKREALGKWFVIFVCETESKPLEPTDEEVGIDLGLKTFAMLSNEEVIENPMFLKDSKKKLEKIQTKINALPKGSNEKHKEIKVKHHIYEKIVNKRDNFLHQESRKLVNRYQNIYMEDLDIKEMMEVKEQKKNMTDEEYMEWRKERYIQKKRNTNIGDVSWNKFVNFINYKAEEAGRTLKLVNPRNTSKTCSGCGNIKYDLTTKDRTYKCSKCGLKLDRDLNASYNILRLGLESVSTLPSGG